MTAITWSSVSLVLYTLSEAATAVNAYTSIVTGANGYVGRAIVHELVSRIQQSDAVSDIMCLVRAQHVQTEQDYWDKYYQQQKLDSDGSSLIKNVVRVLPYDMLDSGVSLEEALLLTRPAFSAKDLSSPSTVMRRVFHVASVFGPTSDHTQTALDNVRGTEDLVRTLARVGNCQLILTSSMAAVRGTGQEPINQEFYTSHDWNTASQLHTDSWGASYQWSKAESERRAWALSREFNVPMVSLCPSFVFGPALAPAVNGAPITNSYSCALVQEWLRGESPVQSRLCVDVRNVARAHVEAAWRPQAVGKRYIVSAEARTPSQEIASWLQDVCRQANRHDLADKIHSDDTFTGGSIPIGTKEVEASKILQDDLGVTLLPVVDTISDMARSILERQ